MAHMKKHGQSHKDRMHEKEGMEHHMEHRTGHHSKGGHHSFVTGHDPAVGRGDHAGMPKEVVMSDFPRSRVARGPHLDDTISGIDDVVTHAEGQSERYLSHQK